MKEHRTVVFLDIDGVLQPFRHQYRFDHDLDKLREDLAAKYNNDDYRLNKLPSMTSGVKYKYILRMFI